MKRLQRLLKWTTLVFFAIAFFSMTVGQAIPIEFADWHHMHIFYDIILRGLPVATLLTLTWTMSSARSRKINIVTAILTPIVALMMFFWSASLMFSYGFGAWVDEEILYKNKRHPQVTINQQLLDMGALGYGGHRTVKLTPFLGLWNIAEETDSTEIDSDKWLLIQKEGNLKFP